MGQRLTFAISNSQVAVGIGIEDNSEKTKSLAGYQTAVKPSKGREEFYQDNASETEKRAEFIKDPKKRTIFNQTNEGKMKLRVKQKCVVDNQ